MSDYTTQNNHPSSEGTGKTGLVVAAVLIGLFVLVLAMLGTGTIPEDSATPAPGVVEQAPAAPPAPAVDG